MIIVITIVSTFVLVGLLVFLIVLLIDYLEWKGGLCKTAPMISFRTFKTMYELNPDSFNLYRAYFKCRGILVEFNSYINMTRYKMFVHNIKKNNIKEERLKATNELINTFQKDIDDYKKQQESELKKYSDAIIKQVKESTERYEKLKSELDYGHMIGGIYEFWKISTNETMTETGYFPSIEAEKDWKDHMMLKGWTLIKKVALTYGENNK